MTEHDWQWWAGDDERAEHGPFATKDEAIEAAKANESQYVFEAKQGDFILRIDGDDALSWLNDVNEELVDQDGDGQVFEGVNEAAEKDLGKMLTAALHAWIEKHGFSTTAWAFDSTRNMEAVKHDDAEEN